MGCCQSAPQPEDPPPQPERQMTSVTASAPAPTAPPQLASVPSSASSRQRSRVSSTGRSTQPHTPTKEPVPRTRVVSAPQQMQSTRSSSSQNPRTRAQSIAAPRGNRPEPMPMPDHPRAGRALASTVKQVLSNHPKFRILVVGKRSSGKSSLINAVFKIDISAAPRASGNPDINHELHPADNRYLIVHEYSGFQPGDSHGLQAIREFITRRTDPSRSNAERLHAIWICVPTSDATSGGIGEGVEEILSIRRAPVVVAFTKFDQAVTIEGGNSSSARTRYEQSCRSLFRKEPRDVPAEIVSVRPQYGDLINNLVVMTDRFITGIRNVSNPSARSSAQGGKPRIAPIPLVWSAASRVNQDIIIQASIEVGRSRYWRSLWSSLDFADQPLKNCVNIIHTDIIYIWNLKERNNCLSNPEFKAKMSHVVKDLAGSVGSMPPSPDFAEWVYDVYRGSQENVRCVMGYIVDLTVILDDVFRATASTTGNVSSNDAQLALDRHIRTGRRDMIHRDIHGFVTETFGIRFNVPQRDLVLEKIIDLIRQYCVPPSLNGNG